ncbi:hypothetical protein XNW1_1890007 [Xenorhabdus nematophila str. Websteri]|nr:hypothetical protein XNW1_1890007 [Xenorhabdus nematophila str. Websteri]
MGVDPHVFPVSTGINRHTPPLFGEILGVPRKYGDKPMGNIPLYH